MLSNHVFGFIANECYYFYFGVLPILASKYYRQQTSKNRHHNQLMFKLIPYFFIAIILLFSVGCTNTYKGVPILLSVEEASKNQLMNEIDRFAKVNSMRAKMDFKYEDTSYAQQGSKKSFYTVNADIIVQRPANIFLKVDVFSADLVQMTSNGENFRVAILKDDCGGRCKKFVKGTNKADYSKLQSNLSNNQSADAKSVNSFANVRPQHFTDAILVRPIDSTKSYLQSTIFQTEEDETQKKNAPLRKVVRGYYLLDEFVKDEKGELQILRRFWFDRVGGIHLSRQQVFDSKGEIESDIVYGSEGNIGKNGEYRNLPLRIQITRPKDKYVMVLTYQSPESVTLGKSYPVTAFELKNTWGLEELDLDQKLNQANGKQVLINNQ